MRIKKTNKFYKKSIKYDWKYLKKEIINNIISTRGYILGHTEVTGGYRYSNRWYSVWQVRDS